MNLDALNRWFNPMKIRIMGMLRFGVINSLDDTKTYQSVQVETLRDVVKDGVPRFQNYGFSSSPQPGSDAIVVNIGGDQSGSVIIACENRKYRFKGLASGEVVLYTDEGDKIHFQRGKMIDIETGTLTINASVGVNITSPKVVIAASGEVDLTTPTVKASAAVSVGSNIAITGNSTVGGNETVTGNVAAAAVAAGNFTGAAGGAMSSSSSISTTGDVSGGGTSLSAIKSKFNSHTHNAPSGGGNTSVPTPTI